MGIVLVTVVSRQKSGSLPAKGKKYGFVGSLIAVSSLFGLALFQVGRFHPPSRRRAITKPNQALRRRSWQNGNGPRCFLARRPAQSVSGTPRHRVSGACIFERKRCINRRTNGATLALFKESSLTSKSSPILRRSRASLNPPSTRETPRGRRRPSRPKSRTRRNARGIPLHRVKNNVLFSRVIVLRRCQGAPLCGGRVTTCCEAIDSLI